MMRAGRPEPQPIEANVPSKQWYACDCSPNNSFKSSDGICPKCGSDCALADQVRSDNLMDLNPKIQKPTNKPVSVKIKALTERDYREKAKMALKAKG